MNIQIESVWQKQRQLKEEVGRIKGLLKQIERNLADFNSNKRKELAL